MIAASDFDVLIGIADRLGVVVALLLILFAGWRRWWVFSWVYSDLLERHETLRKERDEWKEIALRSTNLAETLDTLRKYGSRA